MVWGVLGWLVASTAYGLGNTVGYHRMLTHRSFVAVWPVRALFVILGALHSGSPLAWVGLHRLHHAKSDGEGDPHSPRDGFWHAHCGWLIGTKNPIFCALFAISGFGQQAVILVHDLQRLAGRRQPTWRELTPDLNTEWLLRALDTPLVLPALLAVSRPGGPLLLLIKPQFEAGRQEAAKGRGVITDPAIHDRVIEEVRSAALSHGAVMLDVMVSPITGNAGNVEFVGYLRASPSRASSTIPSGATE